MKKIILLILIILLSACKYTELNNLSIIKTMSIDYDNGYIISVKVLNDKEKKIYEGRNKTISGALENIKLNTNKELYLKHLENVLIVEHVGKKGIDDIVEYFINNQLISKDFNLFVTKSDIIEKFKNYEDSNKIKFNNFLNNSKIYPYINVIPYIEDNTINKLAVFDDKKLVDFVDNIDLYNILINKTNSIYNIKCQNNNYNSYYIENVIQINNTNFKININKQENNCNLTKKYINNYFEREIYKMINNYDVLGITRNIYLNKNVKKNYNTVDKNIEVSVNYG